ncbi:MAG: rhomboid family intramembrane serine protease [Verrucomicrobiota bacterium]
MGIADRDYTRHDYSGRGSGAGGLWSPGHGFWTPVCKWLLIINIVVFLGQIFTAQQGHIVTAWLGLDTALVLKGQVWRLLTMAFCHDPYGLFHIVFNMLFLVWFGRTLERMYGSGEFLRFYLAAALVASIAQVGLDLVLGTRGGAIGASGAVMGVTMLYAMHYPRQKIYIWMIIPVEIRWIVLFYVLFDLHPVLLALAGQGQDDNIAHAAHLGGLAFGFLYHRFGWNLERVFLLGGKVGPPGSSPKKKPARQPKSKKPKGPQPKFTVVRSDPMEERLNQLLDKIAAEGQSSLTEEEKKFLESASKEYRNRDGGEEE